MPTVSDEPASRSRTRIVGAILIVLVLLGVLVGAYGQDAALGAIHFYQRRLAAVAEAAGVQCRMTPTCSRYAEAVIARDGLLKGGVKAAARIARCGPWTPTGTEDPP
jgi:putative membrane protein insertion efficiency factor